MSGRQLLVLMGMSVAHRPRRIRRLVCGTQPGDPPPLLLPPERWESHAIKVKQTQTNKVSVLKVKGVHGWCPAASSFSSGSLHFKGTLLLGYASLTVRLYCGSSLWNEADLGLSMYVSSSVWICQCVATGWQAGFLWDWPSPLLLRVSCLQHQI